MPFFPEIVIDNGENSFAIKVKNFSDKNRYIKSILLNGEPYDKLWINHKDLTKNSTLIIEASPTPTEYGMANIYVPTL